METLISAKIENFFSQYPQRKYNKGQIIIFAHDNPKTVFHIVEGMVKQYDVTYRGDEVILNIFKAPAFFPMSLAINNSENPYTYEAEENSIIRVAPAQEVIDFIKSNPDILFDLMSRVYNGIDGILGRMVHLMASSAKGRLMFEILIACRRHGEELPDGSHIVKINERELGSRTGMSRETVSREMSKLVKEQIVSLHKGVITIKDINLFESKLGKVI